MFELIHISPLRSEKDKFTLYQIKVLCCCTVWLLSCKHWAMRWERQREERKSNFLSLFKAHLKFGMKELILDNLLIPLNSQMKNVFEILKAALKFIQSSIPCTVGILYQASTDKREISQEQWSEKQNSQNSQPHWMTKWGNTQLTISILPVLPYYYYSKSSKWPGMGFSYIINKIWQHWKHIQTFFPLKFTDANQKQPWSSLSTCVF